MESGADERPTPLLEISLDVALAVSGALAARLLLVDDAGGWQTPVERGPDRAALNALATVALGAAACGGRADQGAPGVVVPPPEVTPAGWRVAVVPVVTTTSAWVGALALAWTAASPGVVGEVALLGLGRQVGGAVEQTRWLAAERARVDAALRRARADSAAQTLQLQAIVAQAAEAIFACDAAGQIILANLPAARMFGLDSVDDMSRPISALLARVEIRASSGARLSAPDLLLSRALTEGRPVSGEYAIHNQLTGEESFRRVSAAPLFDADGRVQGAIMVASDISALVELQRLAEIEVEAATRQGQRLQAIIDALADPICVFDPDWRVLLYNDCLIKTLGLPGDILGRHATELDDLVPGRFVQMEAAERVTSLAARVRAAAVDEVTVGEPPRIFRRAASGVYDEAGQPLAHIFLYHDITLVREVERLKDEFLAAVSHDLRSPLHHIKGYTSTLLRQDVAWDADMRRRFLGTIDRECDRMTQIVGNLLDLSRLEADTTWLQPRACDLDAIIGAAVERAREAIDPHPLDVRLPASLGMIVGDGRWLERLMVNLLDNAAKYSPDGAPITVSGWRAADRVVVAITDRGIGIAAEHVADIFRRFYRVSNGGRARGSGLGLAICRRIVEAHGGAIWVESEPDQGSTFFVSLPTGGPSP